MLTTVTFAATVTDRTRAPGLDNDRLGAYNTSIVYVTVLDDGAADLTAHAIVAGSIGDGMILTVDVVAI